MISESRHLQSYLAKPSEASKLKSCPTGLPFAPTQMNESKGFRFEYHNQRMLTREMLDDLAYLLRNPEQTSALILQLSGDAPGLDESTSDDTWHFAQNLEIYLGQLAAAGKPLTWAALRDQLLDFILLAACSNQLQLEDWLESTLRPDAGHELGFIRKVPTQTTCFNFSSKQPRGFTASSGTTPCSVWSITA